MVSWLESEILDRHTGASPEDQSKHRFDEFRSDLSSFFHLKSISLCETRMVKKFA